MSLSTGVGGTGTGVGLGGVGGGVGAGGVGAGAIEAMIASTNAPGVAAALYIESYFGSMSVVLSGGKLLQS
jgi:hypothetical protein